MKVLSLATVVSLLVGLAPARADGDRLDNWHQWRGPLGTGAAPRANPPIHWDATKNVRWKAPLSGRGSATPIVWGDQIFVVTAVPTEKAARAEDLPRVNPEFERKTQAPANYWRFLVLSF